MVGKVGYMGEFPDFNIRGFNIEEYNKQFTEGNIVIHAHSKEIFYPEHWGGLSVKCAFNGKEFYKSSNSLCAVDDDHYLIFNEGKYYSSWIDAEANVESFTLNIAPSFASSFFQSVTASHTSMLDDPFMIKNSGIRFSEKLYPHNNEVTPVLLSIKNYITDFDSNKEKIAECFYLLIEQLYQHQFKTNLEIKSVDKLKLSTQVEIFERLTRAKDLIYSDYSSNLSLLDIANSACMNQFYFLRQFKKLFKITPHQFLTQRRMQVASEMLRKNDKGVTEICTDVGFSDIASFSKLFKKTSGLSPVQYRSLHKNTIHPADMQANAEKII